MGTDVFISYAHEDAAWVRRMADALKAADCSTFLDEDRLRPGDRFAPVLEQGIREATAAAIVLSRVSVRKPWVQEEYGALLNRAVDGHLRLIPVLLEDVELPPFLASRDWVDFRRPQDFEASLAELVRGIRDVRPAPTGGLVVPSDAAFRIEGARSATLRVSAKAAELITAETSVADAAPGLGEREEALLWELQRERQAIGLIDADGAVARVEGPRLLAAGRMLGERFLAGAVGAALAEAVQRCERTGSVLRLALELDDPELVDLPWETLVLPGTAAPLVLHPRVALHRAVPGLGATPVAAIRGPLRILAVVGSPERGGGELLDMEAELARILDAVDAARREERAYVRVLNWGTVDAIREALERERFHVLHISGHAGPGELMLEDDRGEVDRVTAQRLVDEAFPSARLVPLVVLTGCSTALADTGEAALPGLARELLTHGVPAVLAMTAPVTDDYATRLGADFYRELARRETPDPLTALADVRRRSERDRPPATSAEWATPTLLLRGPGLPLFDRRIGLDDVEAPSEPDLGTHVVARRVGEFVGRRRELRELLRDLRGPRGAVVIHGIGGVGKSTLAAQLVHHLADHAGLVVPLHGRLEVDAIFATLGSRLLARCLADGAGPDDPLRRLATELRDASIPWDARLGALGDLLAEEPILLLLDNFEDNLSGDEIALDDLEAFLKAWIAQPGRTKLLVTCRHPFRLRHLVEHPLGPLSRAEVRKLFWRLPALDALSAEEQERAYVDVGGHPRALEYLDALLRGGEARFDDVAERMEDALAERGVRRPERWLAGFEGDLDRALAETVTFAVDDVLLGSLLERLSDDPLAYRLFTGASVYRVPVDKIGLAFQVVDDEVLPEGLDDAIDLLADLGLLALVDDEQYLVHRWTAGALRDRVGPEQHTRAAQFWLSRAEEVEPLLEAREHLHRAGEDHDAAQATMRVCELLDTRGAWTWERRLCEETLGWVASEPRLVAWFQRQLGIVADNRGDYDRARLHYEAMLGSGIQDVVAVARHQLGTLAQRHGQLESAEEHYEAALAIVEALGDRAALASSYHQLGMLAQERGDFPRARREYERSLAIHEELGAERGVAGSFHQLGNLSFLESDLDAAIDFYERALAINRRLGDRAAVSAIYNQLGMVAYAHGDLERALGHARRALVIDEELGDRAGMASSLHRLGLIAAAHGDDDGALAYFRRSLALAEALGDPTGIADNRTQIDALQT